MGEEEGDRGGAGGSDPPSRGPAVDPSGSGKGRSRVCSPRAAEKSGDHGTGVVGGNRRIDADPQGADAGDREEICRTDRKSLQRRCRGGERSGRNGRLKRERRDGSGGRKLST